MAGAKLARLLGIWNCEGEKTDERRRVILEISREYKCYTMALQLSSSNICIFDFPSLAEFLEFMKGVE